MGVNYRGTRSLIPRTEADAVMRGRATASAAMNAGAAGAFAAPAAARMDAALIAPSSSILIGSHLRFVSPLLPAVALTGHAHVRRVAYQDRQPALAHTTYFSPAVMHPVPPSGARPL